MMNLNLPFKLRNGKSWSEEKPDFFGKATQTWGADFGSVTLNVRINGKIDNVREAIKSIVGYSTVWPIFDPFNPVQQGPYRLSRITPARHPGFPNLRATKILSIVGEGNRNTPGEGKIKSGDGSYGEWYEVVMAILFEIPKYAILSDNENSLGGDGVVRRPEYRRYTEWFPEEALETIARKGATWSYVDLNAHNTTPTFAGDRLLRQPKASLRIVTYDVHIDYIMLGKIIPSNAQKRLSTLNARPFPIDAYPDQNNPVPGKLAQYEAGTLLLTPSKYPSHAQAHPAVMQGQISPDLFPRTVDIERNMLIFNPPSNDETTVDLSAYGGAQLTRVRGHNLTPLPRPCNVFPQIGQIWFTATNTPYVAGRTAVLETELLYQYSDFEKLWTAPESM